MRKLISIFLLFSLVASAAIAQIGEPLLTNIRNDKYSRNGLSWIKPTEEFAGKTYQVKFHVISTTQTGTKVPIVSQGLVNACLDNLNAKYKPARILFVNCEAVNFVYNSNYSTITDAQVGQQRSALMASYNVADCINIYIANINMKNEDGLPVAGFTHHPLENINFIAIDESSCLDCVLTHEMGHFLGLLHTHEYSFGKENVDGTNCRTAGDLLCDTKADPGLKPLEANKYTILGSPASVSDILWRPNLTVVTNPPMQYERKFYVTKCNWDSWKADFLDVNSNPCQYKMYTNESEIVYENVVQGGKRDHIFISQPSFTINSLEWREIVFEHGEGLEICEEVKKSTNPNLVYNFGGCKPCIYFGTEKDPKGQSYSPPTENYMSYSGCGCSSIFTVEQISEMHYWSTQPVRLQFQNFDAQNLTNLTILTGNATYSQQNIITSNVSIGGNANVVLDHCNTTSITNDFSVAVGSTLEIK